MKSYTVTIQMKSSIEKYFTVVLSNILYKVVLTFESLNVILNFDRLNKRLSITLLFVYRVPVEIKVISSSSFLMLFAIQYKVSLWLNQS